MKEVNKKWYCFITLLLLLSGCTQYDEELLQNEKMEVFTAFISAENTRTGLADDGKGVLWNKGDALTIFRKNSYNTKYVLSTGENTKSGVFKYASVFTGDGSIEGIDQYYSVYPYDGDITITTDKKVMIVVPEEQTYIENSFDGKSAFMTAVSATEELSFKNACSVLKVNLKSMPGYSYDVSKLIVSSKTKAMNGEATIDMTSSVPVMTLGEVTDNNKVLTLNCGKGIVVDNPTNAIPFYLLVAPGTYPKEDLTLTVCYTNGTSESVVIPAELTFERNKIFTANYICGNNDIIGGIPDFTSTDADLKN